MMTLLSISIALNIFYKISVLTKKLFLTKSVLPKIIL